ncbi:MAG: AraC family transcriptional regulator [Prevotella sp.]|jgi:AraC-like DNA-binding protein|nr:AraC family transcriptional regulator [Prevotella sp.]
MIETSRGLNDSYIEQNRGPKINEALDGDVMFLHDLRKITNLSAMRKGYNTIIHCQGGRILVEIGGNQQVKIRPGQMLLIPAGKLVQPLMISTDVNASVLLISDKTLKSALGNQLSIWNKAMYMKEIYVVEEAGWVEAMESYARTIFKTGPLPVLFREILSSFLRMMLLMICEELMQHDDMTSLNDASTTHDKEVFNEFLQLLSQQNQKRQRVSYYADKMNISPKYLSSICKKVSGKNPMRWITENAMQDCYSLLKDTDLSVKEISNRLGFPNPSFFGQYFREQAGVTPMEYRIEHKRI